MSPLYFISQFPFVHWDLLPPGAHCVLLGDAVQYALAPPLGILCFVRRLEAAELGNLPVTMIEEAAWVQLTITHHPIISW